MSETITPAPSFAPTPTDSMTVKSFRYAPPEAMERLNASLGLTLTPSLYARLQSYFRGALSRDPSIGELRLICALAQAGIGTPDRVAVGELYTDSPAIAHVWAEMMQANGRLWGVGEASVGGKPVVAPPCSLTELLALPTRAITAAGGRNASEGHRKTRGERVRVVSTEAEVARAVACGFTPAEIIRDGDLTLTVLTRRGDAPAPPSLKSGDLILLLPRVTPDVMAALNASLHNAKHPVSRDVRAVANASLLSTLTEMCPAAELYPDRLEPDAPAATLLTKTLCGIRSPENNATDYLVRVRLSHVKTFTAALKELGITPVVWGQVKSGDRYVIRIRPAGSRSAVTVVSLPSALITSLATAKTMTRFRSEAGGLPEVMEAPRLSVSMEGRMALATQRVTVNTPGNGFASATFALEQAVRALTDLGLSPEGMELSLRLEAGDSRDGRIPEILCGIYHAATEASILPADTAFVLAPHKDAAPTLTITAFWRVPAILVPLDIPTPITTNEKGIPTMKHVFEPLSKKPRSVILDTDIGPDCDDVGALVCLLDYAKKYNFPVLGICNCTSNKSGNGAIDAVCRHVGVETPYLGQWHGEGFMDYELCHKYNDTVAATFSEGFKNGTLKAVDEVTFYRTLLAKAEDDSVMVITIGMFNNLASLLESPADDISPLTGMELVKAKVNCLVSMAAILPEGRECNVISDYLSAKKVFETWPTAVYLSDFHVGWQVMTGYDHIQDPEAIAQNPLVMAYHLYTADWTHLPRHGMNSSYDLTAIQFAAEGEGANYALLDPVDLEFYAALEDQPDLPDATRAIPNPDGKFRFMKKLVSDQEIADSLNEILRKYC